MTETATTEENPFENPLLRYGIGISGAAVIAFVGIFYFEGWLRYLILVIAVLDAIIVPKVLEMTTREQ